MKIKSINSIRHGLLLALMTLSAHAGTVTITGDDAMAYNLKSFPVKSGEKVTLKFSHVGKLPKEAMGHNVVILKAGVDVDKFAQKAAASPKTEYLHPGGAKDIVSPRATPSTKFFPADSGLPHWRDVQTLQPR
jgi:azurin